MKHTLLIGALLFLQCIPSVLFSQTDEAKSLAGYVRNINRFNQLNPQEKVYLHFDNTGYFLGETLWFKAYVVSAANNIPYPLSKVLYVELLTPQGEIVDSRKLKIENGGCHGEFRLSKEYNSGFYEVRAYTLSMLNFGEECVFSRVFPIYNEPKEEGNYAEPRMSRNSDRKSEREKTEQKQNVNLSFYPEGGSAVVGIPSRIAFKAVDKKGEDMDITGVLYNKQGEAVATFSTLHQGMGVFELTPESTTYTAEVEHEGKKYKFPLTGILSSGYTLKVDQSGEDAFLVQVQKSPGLADKMVAVSVSCQGMVYVADGATLDKEPYSFEMQKDKLPAGSIQFTLFDAEGRVLAERYAFNSLAAEHLTVRARVQQEKLKPFEEVDIEFSVQDKAGNPVETTFSLAVRDIESEPRTAYQDNILTYLLLSSEVKGYIEKPGQYFEKNNPEAQVQLDLLMLVQAWRRYNWQQMAGVAPFEAKHYAEESLGLQGRVLWYTQNKPQVEADLLIRMSGPNGESFFGSTRTDKEGKYFFIFSDDITEGRWDLVLQVSKNGKRQHSRILIDRVINLPKRTYHSPELWAMAPLSLEAGETTDSVGRRDITEMQYMETVVVSERRQTGDGFGPDIILDVERDITMLQDQGLPYPGTLGEYVESKVSQIRHISAWDTINPEKYHYVWAANRKRPLHWLSNNDWDKAFTLERDSSHLEKFHQVDIGYFYKVEIHHSPTSGYRFFGQRKEVSSGFEAPVVINAFVYEHRYGGYTTGVRHTHYDAFNKAREFYDMDHSEKELGNADFTRTLYWNPNVSTDKEGNAQVDFFNNSSCKQVSISAEGLHSDGRPVVLQEIDK